MGSIWTEWMDTQDNITYANGSVLGHKTCSVTDILNCLHKRISVEIYHSLHIFPDGDEADQPEDLCDENVSTQPSFYYVCLSSLHLAELPIFCELG